MLNKIVHKTLDALQLAFDLLQFEFDSFGVNDAMIETNMISGIR